MAIIMQSGRNIYCDESSHLQNDHMPFMVLGAVSCSEARSREANIRLREIKVKHSLPASFELKWSKVSPGKLLFYRDVVDYFFDDDDLMFRAVVAPKEGLDHASFAQSHDDWYYKMMFLLVRNLIHPNMSANVYLDKKDTRSGEKVARLHRVLANSKYDFDRTVIRRVQIVESHHVNLIQLADLLAGAVNYANRGLASSGGKLDLIARIRQRAGVSLLQSTLPSAPKLNIFHWRSQ